ncbi:ACP S-malonyltransferase [Roseivirga sp. BDSF3-8]|uniref:ACP S-malonyltransferase n=1 Tax=Roseivirga sp. BDSF3-8 TaxID=3241598 RepID=UPI003532700C
MKKAYIFPGQGSQYQGMGKALYESNPRAKELFDKADEILGFSIKEVMFTGSDEDLKQTNVTQPAIFLHSVAIAETTENFAPDMVAGHSLGEISALVAAKAISFEDGLKLVAQRANAMQKACEANPSTMAAILALTDDQVKEICAGIDDTVVAANFNSPGQVVISGTHRGIEEACEKAKAEGARRAMVLKVGGAFHSPLMEPAREELEKAIRETTFKEPICPVYQNVDARPHTEVETIKSNLIAQLTAPVRWTQTVEHMHNDGASEFIECGPGKVLRGLVKKIVKDAELSGLDTEA